jgi:hypothetical protein
MAITVFQSHVAVTGETFDPDTVLKLIDANPRPLLISGWILNLENSTTDPCPIGIGYGDGTAILAGTIFPFDKASADQPRVWTVTNVRMEIPADAGLALIGGATASKVNGIVFVRLR